jgi:hypothetical protein
VNDVVDDAWCKCVIRIMRAEAVRIEKPSILERYVMPLGAEAAYRNGC